MSAALTVITPGPCTTVQDLGRFGRQGLGVPVAGALDPVSLRLANRLVGNPEGEACLEILQAGPTLQVAAESVRIALAGTQTALTLPGEEAAPVPAWRSVTLERGERLQLGSLVDSGCAYLAVAGGFALDPVLGSRSTYRRAGLGGFQGRALQGGDTLPLRHARVPEGTTDLALHPAPDLAQAAPIRVIPGPQADHFTEAGWQTFLRSDFTVSAQSDRMGLRLDGPRLAHVGDGNIVSDGIATGAIQVPGSGQPIILLADHQTTGGYAKIATVISADLPRLGRCRAGQSLRFQAVTVEDAEPARRDLETWIATVAAALRPVGALARLDPESLYRENLITGLVSEAE